MFGLWLTVGAANAAQADLISRLLVGHARAPQLLRLERNSSETLRTVLGSVDQVIIGVVASSVSLVANIAVAVAVALGLVLSSPVGRARGDRLLRADRGRLGARRARRARTARSARPGAQEERYRLVMQGISAAKELQLRGRALFYAEGAVARTRGINTAMRGASVANGSLRYMLETSLVVGAVLVVAVAGLTSGRDCRPPGGRARARRRVPLAARAQPDPLPEQPGAVQQLGDRLRRAGAADVRRVRGRSGRARSARRRRRSARARAPARRRHVPVSDPRRAGAARRQLRASGRASRSASSGRPGRARARCSTSSSACSSRTSGRSPSTACRLRECREAWQRSIGYVPQDVYLVDDTLRANVALGWYGDEIDDERVVEAIRLAGLEDVVAELPDGAGDGRRRARRAALRGPAAAGRARAGALHAAERARPRRGDVEPRPGDRAADRRDARRAAGRGDDDRRHASNRERASLRPDRSTSSGASIRAEGTFDEIRAVGARVRRQPRPSASVARG